MGIYIHQRDNWTNFTWDEFALSMPLGKVRNLQGKLSGKMEMLGFVLQQEALLETLTLDVLKSTEIEGEFLNIEQVRSSLARRLGMDIIGLVPSCIFQSIRFFVNFGERPDFSLVLEYGTIAISPL